MGILTELFSRPIRRGNSLADAPLRALLVQDVNPEAPLPYERRNSPTGIEYEGKQYRTGQFLPGSVMFTHTGTRHRDERWTPKPPPDVQPTEYGETDESVESAIIAHRRKRGAKAQDLLVGRRSAAPITEAASRLVDALTRHGPLKRSDLLTKTRIYGPAFDAALAHALEAGHLNVEERPGRADGSGPKTQVRSLRTDPIPDTQPTEYADEPDPNELAAWEASIDADPLDALTHGAYADWLQDLGHDEEATFRRAMGDWIGEAHGRSPVGAFHVHTDAVPDDFNYSIWWDHLPEWARDPNAPESVTERFFGRTRTEPHVGYSPNPYWVHWRGRRNMEEGLRRAHRAGSPNPGPISDVQPTE